MPDLRKPSQTLPAASRRSDLGALLFAIACAGIAAALAFADYLPQRASIAIVGALALLFVVRAFATRTLVPRTAADWPNGLILLLLPVGLLASADRSVSWPVVCKILGGLAVFYGLAGLTRTRWLPFLPWLILVLSIGFTAFIALGTAWPTSKMPIVPAGLFQALPRATASRRGRGRLQPEHSRRRIGPAPATGGRPAPVGTRPGAPAAGADRGRCAGPGPDSDPVTRRLAGRGRRVGHHAGIALSPLVVPDRRSGGSGCHRCARRRPRSAFAADISGRGRHRDYRQHP